MISISAVDIHRRTCKQSSHMRTIVFLLLDQMQNVFLLRKKGKRKREIESKQKLNLISLCFDNFEELKNSFTISHDM